ncbi:MAG: hypothetical protein V7641_217 [Blastocatellia bacterium]
MYEFGTFRLSTAERMLLRAGEAVPLTPKVFDVLVLLVERCGHLFEREALLSAVWADSIVEEANLTVSISVLRKALGEQADGRPYIETVPKRGYRFVADVRVVEDEPEDSILREQTRALVIIGQEEERDDQNEAASEEQAHAQEQAKAQVNKRVRRLAMTACVVSLVLMAGVAYWWQAIRAKPARAVAQIRSIAVLPFSQMGEGKKDELVGFGMADVLITKLGSLNRITVRPTSAVFKYIDTEPDIVAVGRELKVDAVLEGSLRRLGEQMRVTVRLVRARDGELLWAETFDGRFKDQFAIQDEMSDHVAVALLLNPAGEQKRLLTKRYTQSTEAYQAYMKGRYFWNKRTMDSLRKAIEYFEQAIKNDSNYAQAYTGLADCYSLLVNYSQVAPEEGFPKAKAAATQALRLDNAIAEAHASLAKIHHLYDWDWEAAEREFKRALELNPDYATAHQWYGEYLISMERFDEAKAEMKRALELDPVSIAINVAQGFPFYYAREYDEAITAYRKALELDPGFYAAYMRLTQVYIQKRMYDEAIAAYVATYADSPRYQEMVKTAYAVSGMKGFFELTTLGTEEGLIRQAYFIALNYIHLGEQDEAFKWLEKAYQNRSHSMVGLKVDPAWDDLRADPRFTDLLRRMHLEP